MAEINRYVLGVEDYAVIGSMLTISAGIGLYYRMSGGRQKTTLEYLLADRGMPILPVSFSLMASFMSAVSIMGLTREIYMFGTQFLAINISYCLGTPIISYIFLPVFFRQQSPSVYAYLEKRFGYPTRIVASLSFTFQMIVYMGIVLYAPAIALEAVSGLPFSISVVSVGLVCTFYSTIGGMKAVLMNDLFQSILMFGSVLSVIVAGVLNVGDVTEAFEIAASGNRLQFLNLSPDPTVRHTLWSQAFGGIFLYCSLYGVNQIQVQRLLTIKELKTSKLSLWLQLPIVSCLSFLTGLAGIYMYAFYAGCDPVALKRIDKSDQLMPLMVLDTMSQYRGLSGFFIAGIFSASLSSVSSSINSLAAVTLEDYIKPFRRTELSESVSSTLLKVLAAVYGCLSVGLAFLVETLGGGVLQAALSIFGIVGGPLLGLFSLGMCCPMANSIGGLSGLLSSLSLLVWMSFGQPRPRAQPLPLSAEKCSGNVTYLSEPPIEEEFFYLYRVSYAWYTMIGFIVCCAVGIAMSAITNKFRSSIREVDPDLFIGIIRKKMQLDQINSLENQKCVKNWGRKSNCTNFDKTTTL